jgi:transcription elongation factor S-II
MFQKLDMFDINFDKKISNIINDYLPNPNKLIDLNNKILKSKVQLLKDLENNPITKVRSNLIKCGKCKNSNISINQRQTRSGDEGMTVYYQCIDCNNSWKS